MGAGTATPVPSPAPPEIAEQIDRARRRLSGFASRLVYFDSVGSTNDVARALAASSGSEGLVVLANGQTAGRGRRGHAWFSPPGSGLYVSVLLSLNRDADHNLRRMQLLTLNAGLALAEAIDAVTGLAVDLKWPNDLYVGRRKLGGILSETASSGGVGQERELVVVGYGLNLSGAAYPPDLRDRATSLEAELGGAVDRSVLFVETLAALVRRHGDLVDNRFDAILDAWRRRSPTSQGTVVKWTEASGVRSGVTAGVDGQGALLVQIDGRLERIVAGELIWSI